jgi:hypothetical protein
VCVCVGGGGCGMVVVFLTVTRRFSMHRAMEQTDVLHLPACLSTQCARPCFSLSPKERNIISECLPSLGPPLWSSGQSFWLQMQRSSVGFPALPDFLRSSGSGTGSTQPREYS